MILKLINILQTKENRPHKKRYAVKECDTYRYNCLKVSYVKISPSIANLIVTLHTSRMQAKHTK